MHEFHLLPDTVKMRPQELLQRLSTLYRVWAAFILRLGNRHPKPEHHGVSAAIGLRLTPGWSLDSLAEYVVRAEWESALSGLVHGTPTGMGPLQLHSIRQMYGEDTAQAVWARLVEAWDEALRAPPAPSVVEKELAQTVPAVEVALLSSDSDGKVFANVGLMNPEPAAPEPGAHIPDAQVSPVVQGHDSHARSDSTTVP